MVKKVIVIACLSASLLIFLATIDFVHSIFMFLLAGIIPGTNIALSPNQMMVLMVALTGIAIASFGIAPLKSIVSKLHKKTTKKQSAPRRRRLNQA